MKIPDSEREWRKSQYCEVTAGLEWRIPDAEADLEVNREAVWGTREYLIVERKELRAVEEALAALKARRQWRSKAYAELRQRRAILEESIEVAEWRLREEKEDLREVRQRLKEALEWRREFVADNPEMADERAFTHFVDVVSGMVQPTR